MTGIAFDPHSLFLPPESLNKHRNSTSSDTGNVATANAASASFKGSVDKSFRTGKMSKSENILNITDEAEDPLRIPSKEKAISTTGRKNGKKLPPVF